MEDVLLSTCIAIITENAKFFHKVPTEMVGNKFKCKGLAERLFAAAKALRSLEHDSRVKRPSFQNDLRSLKRIVQNIRRIVEGYEASRWYHRAFLNGTDFLVFQDTHNLLYSIWKEMSLNLASGIFDATLFDASRLEAEEKMDMREMTAAFTAFVHNPKTQKKLLMEIREDHAQGVFSAVAALNSLRTFRASLPQSGDSPLLPLITRLENIMLKEKSTAITGEVQIRGLQVLEQVSGTGSLGTVHKAIWDSSVVAARRISLTEVSQPELHNLRKLISALRALEPDPHIVPVFAEGRDGDTYVVVSEWAERADLKTYLAQSKPDLRRRVALLLDVARGMESLLYRPNPIPHGDLKPSNVLIFDSPTGGTAKLSDPGFMAARISALDGLDGTTISSNLPTPQALLSYPYLAPELLVAGSADPPASPSASSSSPLPSLPLNEKTDIYSFGVLMWETLSGTQEREVETPWANMTWHEVRKRVVDVTERLIPPPHIPAPLTELMNRCWSPDASDRPSFPSIIEYLSASAAPEVTPATPTSSQNTPAGSASDLFRGTGFITPTSSSSSLSLENYISGNTSSSSRLSVPTVTGARPGIVHGPTPGFLHVSESTEGAVLVDADGHLSNVRSISAAVKVATAGQRVYVYPGTYTELQPLTLTSLHLIGRGNRNQIVLNGPAEGVLRLQGDSALSNIKIRQTTSPAFQGGCGSLVQVVSGSFIVEDCELEGGQSLTCIHLSRDSNGMVVRNSIRDVKHIGVRVEGRGVVEANELLTSSRDAVAVLCQGDVTVRQNKVFGVGQVGLHVVGEGAVVVEDNDISGDIRYGIEIEGDSSPLIQHNSIHHLSHSAVVIHEKVGLSVVVQHNDMYGCRYNGIQVLTPCYPSIRNNKIHDHSQSGVVVGEKASAVIEENDIYGNGHHGVEVFQYSNPIIKANRIHDGNGSGVMVHAKGAGVIERNHIYANKANAVHLDGDPLAQLVNNVQGVFEQLPFSMQIPQVAAGSSCRPLVKNNNERSRSTSTAAAPPAPAPGAPSSSSSSSNSRKDSFFRRLAIF